MTCPGRGAVRSGWIPCGWPAGFRPHRAAHWCRHRAAGTAAFPAGRKLPPPRLHSRAAARSGPGSRSGRPPGFPGVPRSDPQAPPVRVDALGPAGRPIPGRCRWARRSWRAGIIDNLPVGNITGGQGGEFQQKDRRQGEVTRRQHAASRGFWPFYRSPHNLRRSDRRCPPPHGRRPPGPAAHALWLLPAC